MTRPLIGLALGGGAARGLAHVGVLKVLQREKIPIDIVSGTSAGALIGALYAHSRDAEYVTDLVLSVDRRQLTGLVDLTLPRSGLIEGKKVQRLLEKFIGKDSTFSQLQIPLSVVAADIVTGEQIVISEGLVAEAVRASISIPAVFTVVKWKGRLLVDGGLVNPVPVDVAHNMGADFIIAVNVIPTLPQLTQYNPEPDKTNHKEPGIFHILMQSYYMGANTRIKASMKGADVAINCPMAHIGPTEFHRAAEGIRVGEVATQEAIPEITRLLKDIL